MARLYGYHSNNLNFRFEHMSPVQFEVYMAGDLFSYGKNIK